VAALVADGLTDRQIAERLVITEGTAGVHVANILNKLGVHTRAEIARWSMGQLLVQLEQKRSAVDDCARAAPELATTESGPRLSPREQQVAGLVAEGLTNRQIAERMIVTERTVAAHVEHIMAKLGVSSRTQIGVWAAGRGAVPAL
jgi:DNA-binding NarL/FixJ family response regulator